MTDQVEVLISIGALFTAISKFEEINFLNDQEYFQEEHIQVLDENNDWIDVDAMIVKEDQIRKICFSDNTEIRVANKHRIRAESDCIFVGDLEVNDRVVKSSGESIFVVTNNLENVEPVYDIMVNSPTHLYQTNNGIIHHNTEVARQIANLLNIELVKFDMSEFMEKHSVSKLIGAPPGYVGFSDGGAGSGMLINAIEQTPHCVLLLDEVEKAHQDVFNILLQIMDDGRITAANGKMVKFDNVLLIMTTNLGAANMARNPLGFARDTRSGEDSDAVNKFFSPEFRNRLDAVVRFNKLAQDLILKIVDKFIEQLNTLLRAKNTTVFLHDKARQWLADKGFDDKFGARPLKRVIDTNIKKRLSKEILFGNLVNGGLVTIDVDNNNELTFLTEVLVIS